MNDRNELIQISTAFGESDKKHLMDIAFYGSDEQVKSALYEAEQKIENRR